MFAILVEDNLAESVDVLPTLAADDIAAHFLMLTHAEAWVANQPVTMPYHVIENHRTVLVQCGENVVLELTATEINRVVNAADLKAYINAPKPKDIH